MQVLINSLNRLVSICVFPLRQEVLRNSTACQPVPASAVSQRKPIHTGWFVGRSGVFGQRTL